MLKIAIIADSLDTQQAGIHVYTRNMVDALEQSGKFEVFVIRLKYDHHDQTKKQIVIPPFLPFLQKDPFRIFFSLPHIITKLQPDIVIEPAHFGPFNLPKKIKRVTVIHDLTPIRNPEWHSLFSSTLQRLFLPGILKRASLVITNSKCTSNDLEEQYPYTSAKIAQIYPAANSYYNPVDNPGTFQKLPFFLCVGTIEPRKNLPFLLDAYQLFRERSDQVHQLVICGGNGWKNKNFYRKFKRHPYRDDILLKGFVSREELKYLYIATSAFIFPSLYEGFGFPVLEAMKCGAPCIISNRSSLPEVGGNAALYFDPENSEELTEKLLEITNSTVLSTTLGKRSIEQAAYFSPSRYLMDLEKFLLALK